MLDTGLHVKSQFFSAGLSNRALGAHIRVIFFSCVLFSKKKKKQNRGAGRQFLALGAQARSEWFAKWGFKTPFAPFLSFFFIIFFISPTFSPTPKPFFLYFPFLPSPSPLSKGFTFLFLSSKAPRYVLYFLSLGVVMHWFHLFSLGLWVCFKV